MITGNIGEFLIATYCLAIFKDSAGLECYICGDENLDEDGECHAQFHYDCTNYAKNFEPREPIFCRTMRKRISNDNYTIMKECISGRDHHRIFPPKQYPIDEECDLVEVDGDEFAYCLCRKNLCNLKNIIDQFIDFEERHPEIVATNDDKHEEQFPISTQGGYSTQLNYPLIRNIHQTEAGVHYETVKPVSSDRQSNDNTGQSYSSYGNVHFTPRQIYDIPRLSYQMSGFPLKQNYQPTMFTGNIATNISSEQNKESVQMNKANGKFVASKPIAAFLETNPENAEENENYCYSCTENLNDPAEDCLESKIVQCPISKITGRSQMCITKQLHVASDNLYKLEKRCSTDIEESEVAFDEISLRKIICMIAMDASQTFCLCVGHFCNKDGLLEQTGKVTQRNNGSHSLTNSIFNKNPNSIISSTIAQSQIVANDHIKLAAISYDISSLPNFANKSDIWKLNEMEDLDYLENNGGSSITSGNLFIYLIITVITVLSFLSC